MAFEEKAKNFKSMKVSNAEVFVSSASFNKH